jgi:hypothetical protein
MFILRQKVNHDRKLHYHHSMVPKRIEAKLKLEQNVVPVQGTKAPYFVSAPGHRHTFWGSGTTAKMLTLLSLKPYLHSPSLAYLIGRMRSVYTCATRGWIVGLLNQMRLRQLVIRCFGLAVECMVQILLVVGIVELRVHCPLKMHEIQMHWCCRKTDVA